eukprot:2085826-Rhodomonas_salina.1
MSAIAAHAGCDTVFATSPADLSSPVVAGVSPMLSSHSVENLFQATMLAPEENDSTFATCRAARKAVSNSFQGVETDGRERT